MMIKNLIKFSCLVILIQGITSAAYLEVIGEQLPTLQEPDLIFMQDGVSINTPHIIKN